MRSQRRRRRIIIASTPRMARRGPLRLRANGMVWTITAAIFLGTVLLVFVGAILWARRAEIRAAFNEHRREHRIPADFPLELADVDQPAIHETASAQNISRHGARVLTKTPWRPKDRVFVARPGTAERSQARIAYCASLSQHSFVVGLKFSSALDAWRSDLPLSRHPFGK